MAPPPKARSWSWRSQAFRGLLYQLLAVVLIALALGYLMHNTLENMRVRGIKSGYDFITQTAGFAIGESVIPFDSGESYGKAFIVGLSNTLRVAVVGIVLATLLGAAVGIAHVHLVARSGCHMNGCDARERRIQMLCVRPLRRHLFAALPLTNVCGCGFSCPGRGCLHA